MKKVFCFMFMFLCFFGLTLSTANAESYPSVDTVVLPSGFEAFEEDYEYVVHSTSSNGNTTYVLDLYIDAYKYSESNNASFSFRITNGYNRVMLLDSSNQAYEFCHLRYNISNGAWNLSERAYRTESISGNISQSNFESSSLDIYDSNGDVFFQGPPQELYQIVQMVTAEEIPMFQNKTVGTMRILMVCGVGLIALLVALNLFGKVSQIFRLR